MSKYTEEKTLEERIEISKKYYKEDYLHPDSTLIDKPCCVTRMELIGKDGCGKIERLSEIFSNKLDADISRLKITYAHPELSDEKHNIGVSWNPDDFQLPITDTTRSDS